MSRLYRAQESSRRRPNLLQLSGNLLLLLLLLSLQCYAWKEYKFTCVGLGVCVSVTLSVNSPTGQTPQRIFTVDSLKDADLGKHVPFEVSMMNNHIQGSKVPKTAILGAALFQAKYAKNANSYIYSDLCTVSD